MSRTEYGPYELTAWCECGNVLEIDNISKRDGHITYVSVRTPICPECGSENYEVFVTRKYRTIGRIGNILSRVGMEDLVTFEKLEKGRRVYATFPEKKPSQ